MYQTSSRKRRKNPRDTAGFFSIVSFFFAAAIFRRSKHRDLENSDIYEISPNCKAEYLGDRLQKEWKEEQTKKRHVSLGKTLFRMFGTEYMWYGLLNLSVNVPITIIQPLATGRLVSYFDDSSMPKIHAVFYAGLVFLCGFVQSTYRHNYEYIIRHLCYRVRAALCSLMYRKSLKLTTSSLAEVTNGKIVTLMTKDVTVFDAALMQTHGLWVGMIQLCIMSVIIYRQIGVAALAGIGFLMVIIPLQIWIGVMTKQRRMQTAAKTDERLRQTQDILTSIKLIKLYTWEKYYTKIVNKLRCEEMKKLRAIFYLKTTILGISTLGYRISFFLCFLTYTLMGNTITAEKAFVVLSCYKSLQSVIANSIPMSVSSIAEAKSAFKRIKGFLLVDERSVPEHRHIAPTAKVYANNACARILDRVVLRQVNVDISAPGLVGITGGIGGGKSSFLKMVLHDIDICDGTVATDGKFSYASQEPWLFPGTIRQNILFGNEYDEKRYDTVLHVCALKKDLRSFPERDATVVNDKGVNLSKGQTARINLARAIYKVSDVYLLDDVLSSLDGNVSKHVFDNCIKGFLKDKLCFLVCHIEKYLQRANSIIVFEEGAIEAHGTYNELKMKNIKFENKVKVEVDKKAKVKEDLSEELECEGETDQNLLLQYQHRSNDNIYGEYMQQGKVPWSVYNNYIKFAGGWIALIVVVVICACTNIAGTYFDQYIRQWVELQTQYREVTGSFSEYNQANITMAQEQNSRGLLMYCAIIASHVTLVTLELFIFYTMTVRASRVLHIHVFTKIMAAVMSFFDTHLSGNILNRLSKDLTVIDEVLTFVSFEIIQFTFELICVMGAILYIKPILIPAAFILFVATLYVSKRYLNAGRSIQRLEGITRAPIVGYLNASLEGLTTIRANENQSILKRQFDRHQDLNTSNSIMMVTTQRAFALWVDYLTQTFNLCIFLSFLMYSSLSSKSGDVGFIITEVFGLARLVQCCIFVWAELETLMTALERVLEYGDADQEDLTGNEPANWPVNGTIEYKDVKLLYPQSKNSVLQDINFSVKAGEKIGIVGRTGAGKSSIISVLFRLYKFEGSILVDGVDVNTIKLPTVRSKMSVIPQDPVMFKGTVRTNLDPNGEYTDANLWKALEDVGLKDTIESKGLGSAVDEGGSNWSTGQRQLFCLARAVLRDNRIIVLDEPTANIDPTTDAFVQAAIKRLFAHCTTLTIAHRINTIISCEKIMVIDNGSIVEFDSPSILLSRKRGPFYSIAREAGLVD